MAVDRTTTPSQLPFGSWLIAQQERGGLLGQLAAGAAVDRRFPKLGDPDAVRRHLGAMQVEGDMHAALDDAEIDWMAY